MRAAAAELLVVVEARWPLAVELATLASPAVLVEPRLLRALRLDLAPQLPAAAEGDLWFSPLVSARGPDGITVQPSVAHALRARLRRRWESRADRADLQRLWNLVRARHGTLPEALVIEERVAWSWITGQSVDVLERELGTALEAIAGGTRPGLTAWAGGAWHRLPPDARTSRSGWVLRQAAPSHLRGSDRETAPEGIERLDLARVLRHIQRVAVPLRRDGDVLVLGETDATAAQGILAPDTDPRLFHVTSPDASLGVRLAAGGVERLHVGYGRVRIRTAAGEEYELPSERDPIAERLARTVVRVSHPQASEPQQGVKLSDRHVVTASMPADERPLTVVFGDETVAGRAVVAAAGLAIVELTAPIQAAEPAKVSTVHEPPPPETPWVGCVPGPGPPVAIRGTVIEGRPRLRLAVRGTVDRARALGGPVMVGDLVIGIVVGAQDAELVAVGAEAIERARRRAVIAAAGNHVEALASVLQALALDVHVGLPQVYDERERDHDRQAALLSRAAGVLPDRYEIFRSQAEWVITGLARDLVRRDWHSVRDDLAEEHPSLGADDFGEFAVGIVRSAPEWPHRELADPGPAGGHEPVEISLTGETTDALRLLEKPIQSTGMRLEREDWSLVLAGDADAAEQLLGALADDAASALRSCDGLAWYRAEPAVRNPSRTDAQLWLIESFARELGGSEALLAALKLLRSEVAPWWWSIRDALPPDRPPGDAITTLLAYVDELGRVLSFALGEMSEPTFESHFPITDAAAELLGDTGRGAVVLRPEPLPPETRTGLGGSFASERPKPRLAGPQAAILDVAEWASGELAAGLRSFQAMTGR